MVNYIRIRDGGLIKCYFSFFTKGILWLYYGEELLMGNKNLELTDADRVPFAEDKLIQQDGTEEPLTNC